MATTTVTQFDGSDPVAAKAALQTLAPAATDKVVSWSVGSTVFVSKTTTS